MKSLQSLIVSNHSILLKQKQSTKLKLPVDVVSDISVSVDSSARTSSGTELDMDSVVTVVAGRVVAEVVDS